MRTLLLRSLQALVSISAAVVLMGANDAGCNKPTPVAGAAGGDVGTGGGNTGVACPDGTTPQMVCGTGCGTPQPCDCPAPTMCPPGAMCPPEPACDCPPPPPSDCQIQCVTNSCPMGSHLETVCDPGMEPPVPMDAGAPPPGMGTGMGSGTPGYPGGACHDICVPDSMCPPGTVQQTVCSGGTMDPGEPSDPADPMMPTPTPGACWNECVPVGVPACPPGTHPAESCDDGPMGQGMCTRTCVEDTMAN